MKPGFLIGSVLLLYVVQTTVFLPLAMWGVRPDLVLVFLCAVALSRGWRIGVLAGFGAGFLIDLIEGQLIGVGAISKAVAGGAVGRVGQSLYGGNAFVPVVIVLGASVIEHGVYLLSLGAFGLSYPLADGIVRIILPSAWYDALTGAVLYPLFSMVIRRVGGSVQEHGVGPSEA